ncbi:gliding motility lipoprotein GldD [Leptobacterium sp. I13]|uniref:gliding motility lipoprotein GldD n=1 Tax=Leptobacterium meishanense TaxID=3128904 RepID=UPI0030EE26B9
MKARWLFIFLTILFFGACKKETLPKPKAMLRLEYPNAAYESFTTKCPYFFEKNSIAQAKNLKDCHVEITYSAMKATVHITYMQIENNLDSLLRDAQKLTYEHVVKADAIIEQPYINEEKKVYGMLYEIDGDAASQSQFYITDSTTHFLTGALYFYAKPNYDSILPAVAYLKKDIKKIIESMEWRKN